ncbi:MAG: hypothetical protein EXR77_15110 [Myxococcales bacterium]|nr:hypothetical protein [Myxococcales bacterium]
MVATTSLPPTDGSNATSVAAAEVVVRRDDGPVAILTITRPAALNALNADVLVGLADHLHACAVAAHVRAVIVTGAGEKAFVAGADIAAMQAMSPVQARAFAQKGCDVAAAIAAMPQPVIAAVNGFALGGGCELALACDMILASRKAKLGLPEVTLGVIPGFGGTQRLLRMIGVHAARRWVLSGDVFSADEALRFGVVQEVFEPEDLLPKAIELGKRIASRGPLAVAAAKRVIAQGADQSLADAVDTEGRAFADCFGTADQKEGMAAFLAKRPAVYTGS